jgi:hypothetical protein
MQRQASRNRALYSQAQLERAAAEAPRTKRG